MRHFFHHHRGVHVLRLYIGPIAVLATLFGGCMATTGTNTTHDPWHEAVVVPTQNDDVRALRFYEKLLVLKGAELTRKLETTRQEFEKDRSELNRVQLAMLLSLQGTGFRDDQAALSLVQPFANDKRYENSQLRTLAMVLYAQLSELKRLDSELKRVDFEVKQLDGALQLQTAKAKEEQRRADALQQKLEAILDMEMKMIEREQTSPPKRR